MAYSSLKLFAQTETVKNIVQQIGIGVFAEDRADGGSGGCQFCRCKFKLLLPEKFGSQHYLRQCLLQESRTAGIDRHRRQSFAVAMLKQPGFKGIQQSFRDAFVQCGNPHGRHRELRQFFRFSKKETLQIPRRSCPAFLKASMAKSISSTVCAAES